MIVDTRQANTNGSFKNYDFKQLYYHFRAAIFNIRNVFALVVFCFNRSCICNKKERKKPNTTYMHIFIIYSKSHDEQTNNSIKLEFD